MRKAFTPSFIISELSEIQKLSSFKLAISCAFLVLSFISFSSFGQVTGTVFRDINGNGTKDNTTTFIENGVAGVTVKAYDPSGAVVGTATTSATGSYSIASVSGKLRIEFTTLPTGLFEGPDGTGSKTSVQFVTGPTTNVNFGINCPEQYNTNINPKLYIPCYVNGNPLGGGTAGTDIGFVSFNHADQSTGTTPGPETPLVTTNKLGSVWAVAHSRQASTSFVSAMLKRHMGMGPLGSGGIYLVNSAGTVTNWLDLDAIGIATRGTGTYGTTVSGQSVTFSSVIGTNTQRTLPANKVTPNNDAAAFDQVGKVSLGGMDLSFDGQYLYVVNLFDRKVYQIDVATPASPTAPTSANKATTVKSWAIPNPGCTNGTYRPWACKYYKGKVYIGVVCSGENGGGEADIKQYVYALDPATGFNTTPVLTIPNYSLRFVNDPNTWASSKWQKWTNTMINGGSTAATAAYWSANSPILSDIEFDTDGSMIVGILERGGHQGGLYNYPPSGSTFIITTSSGDVLRAYPNTTMTSWTLENNGDKDGAGPYVAITAQKNTSGPGGGEFYYEDKGGSIQGGPTPDNWHQEVSNGALAFVPGTDITAMVGMDALEFNSGGIFFLNNSTGKTDRRLGIFPDLGGTPALFGKAIGLGDIDYAPEIPPIEIGNRIWNDTDKDGIQDPDELGIDGVTIDIYEGTTKVGTSTSANGGQWYFNASNVTGGLKPNTAYTVKVATALGSGALATYGAYSTKDASSSGQTDYADSDVNTLGEITLTTGNYGNNNHTFDIGVTVAPCPSPNCGTVTVIKN